MTERDLVRLLVTVVVTLGLGVSVLYGRLLLRSALAQLGLLLGGIVGWWLGVSIGGGFGGGLVGSMVVGGLTAWLAMGAQTPLLAVLGGLGGAGAVGAVASAGGLVGEPLSLAMLIGGVVSAFASAMLADVVAAAGAAAVGTGLLKILAEVEGGASGLPTLDWRHPEALLAWQFPSPLDEPLTRVLCVGGSVVLALWLVRIQGLQFRGAESVRGLPPAVRRSGWTILALAAVGHLSWLAGPLKLGAAGPWLGAPREYLGITLATWAPVVLVYHLASAWAWNRGTWPRALGALLGSLAVAAFAGLRRMLDRGADLSAFVQDVVPTSVRDPDLLIPAAFALVMILATAGRR